MPLAPENIGPALRRLRERAGLNQQQLEQRAGLGASSLSRYERGAERPSVPTLVAILNGLGASLQDLGDAIEAQGGHWRERRAGKPRPEWVGVIRDSNFEVAMFRGLAFAGYSGSSEDLDRVEADLVASAEQVARERALAGAKFRRDYESGVALEVAEGPPASNPTRAPKGRR